MTIEENKAIIVAWTEQYYQEYIELQQIRLLGWYSGKPLVNLWEFGRATQPALTEMEVGGVIIVFPNSNNLICLFDGVSLIPLTEAYNSGFLSIDDIIEVREKLITMKLAIPMEPPQAFDLKKRDAGLYSE